MKLGECEKLSNNMYMIMGSKKATATNGTASWSIQRSYMYRSTVRSETPYLKHRPCLSLAHPSMSGRFIFIVSWLRAIPPSSTLWWQDWGLRWRICIWSGETHYDLVCIFWCMLRVVNAMWSSFKDLMTHAYISNSWNRILRYGQPKHEYKCVQIYLKMEILRTVINKFHIYYI